ncbi:MAG: helix-turn-helix domain-containing protein [Tannerella sp.]|jgi:AraC-like DNA-binding protein|nr:helix-turn-helix domain-containing protein [Tannerella sp.]
MPSGRYEYLFLYINQRLNKSFRTWINELRIDEAKRLLSSSPELTVNEIADRTGFANQSNFGRQFLKQTGYTPGAWRKNSSTSTMS